MFSPAHRDLMSQYAELQKQLVPKPGTANDANNVPSFRTRAGSVLNDMAGSLDAEPAVVARSAAASGLNAVAAKALAERSAAGRVARSLYGDWAPAAARDEAGR